MNKNVSFSVVLMAGLKAGVVSIALNVILFYVFRAAGVFTDDIMVQPGQPLSVVPVIASSLFPSVIGALVYFLLERFTKNGWNIFKVVALVIFVVTLANPFLMIPGVTTAFAVVLDVMHVVVAGSLLFFLSSLQAR